ncbi:MAG: YhfC family glutamic-type intramembrane protease [Zestosphaera sp.]
MFADSAVVVLISVVPGLIALTYILHYRRVGWLLPVLGGGGWLIALLSRTPLLYVSANILERGTYLVIASYMAGVFEEPVRYVILRSSIAKNDKLGSALALGLGWGLAEALLLYVIPVLTYSQMEYSYLDLMPGAVERNIAITAHVIFSVLVMRSLSNVKYLLLAIIAHGTLNIAGVAALELTSSAWLTEALLALIVTSLVILIAMRRDWLLPRVAIASRASL